MPFSQKMKRLLLTTTLVAALATPVAAEQNHTLTDISSSYAKQEITFLTENGIFSGYADGTFQPSKLMTRQEVAKVLVKAMNLPENAAAAAHFTDVDDWARPYVGALVAAGITNGTTETTFGAHNPVTREQLAVFFVRAMEQEDSAAELNLPPTFGDVANVNEYAKPHVALMQKIGFLKGGSNAAGGYDFNPQAYADRQAVARLAYEFYTNGENYQLKVGKIEELSALFAKSSEAMGAATSMAFDFNVSGVDAGVTKQLEFHAELNVELEQVYLRGGLPIDDVNLTPFEVYLSQDGIYAMFEEQWYRIDQEQEEVDQSKVIVEETIRTETSSFTGKEFAPFLTMTETDAAYTLTGVVPGYEWRAMTESSDSLASDSLDMESMSEADTDIRVTIVMEKETHYIQSIKLEPLNASESQPVVEISFSQINSLPEIVVPEEAKNGEPVDLSQLMMGGAQFE